MPADPPTGAPEAECIPVFSSCSCAYSCATERPDVDCARACPEADIPVPPVCDWVGGQCVATSP